MKALLEQSLGHHAEARVWRDFALNDRWLLELVRKDQGRLDTLADRYRLKEEIYDDSPGGRGRRQRGGIGRTIAADRRLETLAEIAAIDARRSEPVEWFRGKALGGQCLSPSEVRDWMHGHEPPSPSKHLPMCVRVPVGDLTELAEMGLLASLSPDGDVSSAGVATIAEMADAFPKATTPWPVSWDNDSYADWLEDQARRIRSGEVDPPQLAYPTETLTYFNPTDGGAVDYVRTGEAGAIYFLKLVATWLTSWVPWSLEQAVAFLLTDEPQPLLRASMEADVSWIPALRRIRLRVDPRMPGKEVASFYEAGRQSFMRGRDKQMSEKALALAVFCAERVARENKWKDLRSEWNEAAVAGGHDDWRDKHDDDAQARAFAKDARNAYFRVTGRSLEDARSTARGENCNLSGMTLFILQEDALGERQSDAPRARLSPRQREIIDQAEDWTRGSGDEGTS
ncbi:MAG: hypothetical protein NTX16_11745 [Actinobacteria bacterium]|nr:hypothetical protein [Actinomycetota bacterium]